MINATLMETMVARQESRKLRERPDNFSHFAQMLNDKTQGSDNRREDTGKTADDPMNGMGRREWAHQRSRSEESRRNQNLENKDRSDVKETGQDQTEVTDHPMNLWWAELSITLDQLMGLIEEEVPEVPLKVLKELEALLQNLESFQPTSDHMKVITELLDQLTKMLDDLSLGDAQAQHKDQMAPLLELKRLLEEGTGISQREQPEALPTTKETDWEAIAQTMKAAPEAGTKAINVDESQTMAFKPEETELLPTNLRDHPGSSDTQPDLRESIPTAIMVDASDKRGEEAVIPFSLHQIENLLQQNHLIQELDLQKEQLPQNVMQQVLDKIQVVHGSNQSFVTMHLMPEHLGKLTIHLSSDLQHGMTARIYAETAHAKEMLESNFGQLKDSLSGKGVNLTSMEVFVGQDPESSEKQREFHYQQALSQRKKAGRLASLTGVGTQTMAEHVIATVNPYLKSEGFDQLG